MSAAKYLKTMKTIQKYVLDFLENGADDEDSFSALKDIFNKYKINDKKHELKSLLHLLYKIFNNHHREPYFFSKFEQIIKFFKKSIKNYFSNSEIFNIFKNNKRILLILFTEEIITIDECIIKQFITYRYTKDKYIEYFTPEIKSIKEKWLSKYQYLLDKIEIKLSKDFYDKREAGESDNFIFEMIRNDSVEKFITYVTKNNYPLENVINNDSIYETNSFLLKNKMLKLIEYAAFYGSIQIFNYLQFNRVQLPQTLWFYAIHSKNAELIHLLEKYEIDPQYQLHELLIESIKCHHNNIFEYIRSNCIEHEDNLLIYHLKYYNFYFIDNEFNNQCSFYYLCKYDYYLLVKSFLKSHLLSLDQQTI